MLEIRQRAFALQVMGLEAKFTGDIDGMFKAFLLEVERQIIESLCRIGEEAVIGLPDFILMKFDVSAIITIMPIALATMMEHIGDISAIGATTGKNYIAQPGLHRTLLGDGLAKFFQVKGH